MMYPLWEHTGRIPPHGELFLPAKHQKYPRSLPEISWVHPCGNWKTSPIYSEFFRESTIKWQSLALCKSVLFLFWLVSISVKTAWVNRRFTHMFIDHSSKYLFFDTQSSVQHIKNMIFHITWDRYIVYHGFAIDHPIFHIHFDVFVSKLETSRTRLGISQLGMSESARGYPWIVTLW